MPEIDFKSWVEAADDAQTRKFREAVHVIVAAFASQQELADASFMKGGILLALRYESPRYTSDIDFSTPAIYSEEAATRIREQLVTGLALAGARLGYDTDCVLQSWKIQPGGSSPKTWANLAMRVAYATRGTPAHRRMLTLRTASDVVEIDYSFLESAPTQEVLTVSEAWYVRVYGTTTVIAEKLRAILQQVSRNRARRQDIYDLNFLLKDNDVWADEARQEILSILRDKAADRKVDFDPSSFQVPELYDRTRLNYASLKDELEDGLLPDFDESFKRVKAFYESLPWSLGRN